MSSSEGSDRGSPLMRRSSEYEITENEETESNVNNRSPNNERSETEVKLYYVTTRLFSGVKCLT
jgi:hypothetical protein